MGQHPAGPGPVAGDERTGGIGGTAVSQVAGGSYRQEAQRLIEEQIALLFATVEQAAAAAPDGRRLAVDRTGHTLRVGSGQRAVEFAVEAITEVPAQADPAGAFPEGQARCRVRVAGITVEEWVLGRVDVGSATPTYRWLHAGRGAPITPGDILDLLRQV